MRRVKRNLILIIFVAVVVFAPLFEVFDQSGDMYMGSDFVLALLCAFMATGLFLLCRRLFVALFRLLRIATISILSELHWANRFSEATPSPPQSLLLLGTLRI